MQLRCSTELSADYITSLHVTFIEENHFVIIDHVKSYDFDHKKKWNDKNVISDICFIYEIKKRCRNRPTIHKNWPLRRFARLYRYMMLQISTIILILPLEGCRGKYLEINSYGAIPITF